MNDKNLQTVQKDASLAPSTVEAIGRTGLAPEVTDRRPRAPRAPEPPLDYHRRLPKQLWREVKRILRDEDNSYTTWEYIDETTVMVR